MLAARAVRCTHAAVVPSDEPALPALGDKAVNSRPGRNLEVITLEQIGTDRWDQFCEENSGAWFWHTTAWQDYTVNMRPEYNPQQRSFGILLNEQLVAICPLIEESIPEFEGIPRHTEFSFAGSFGPAPTVADTLPRRQYRQVMDWAFEEVSRAARINDVGRISFFVSPLADRNEVAEHPSVTFARHVYLDASLATHVLDLSAEPDTMLRSMTKGHRADIKRGYKEMNCHVYTASDITAEVFDRYRKLHAAAAGRVTRPERTFEIMYELIKNGRAALAAASMDGKDYGFSYTVSYSGNAYYWSACSDRARRDLPIAHALQWATIQWLKENGCRQYELGWQQLGPRLREIPTEKELSVAKFKRGFGGTTVPLIRAEKYLDQSFFETVMNQRVKAFSHVIGNTGGSR